MPARFIIDVPRGFARRCLTIAPLLLALPVVNACTSSAEAAADVEVSAARLAVRVRAAAAIERPAAIHASGTVDASTRL